jgi:hypothetical protein
VAEEADNLPLAATVALVLLTQAAAAVVVVMEREKLVAPVALGLL